ncbi:MAG: HsdR family type I site-specific deoxyribonuclease [Chrysiogenetes bacterium]|nr:HsdR family type I site-specific deoxyribonuclease [Chrysiogenetes bacterium]
MTLPTTLTRIDALLARWRARVPLSERDLAQLRAHWEVVHTYNSNAIEGNTLTLGETKAVLLDGITISGKPLREILEVTNHREAMRLLYRFSESKTPVSEAEILDLHRLILTGIQADDAGRYRRTGVRVAGSQHVFPNPAKVPALMEEFVSAVGAWDDHPVLVAARAHFKLVAIHPFADGNGRTARLLMNLLLMRGGCPPAYLKVERRGLYYDALEEGHTRGTARFEEFIANAVRESLEETLAALGEEPAEIVGAGLKPAPTGEIAATGRGYRRGDYGFGKKLWPEEKESELPALELLENLGWTFVPAAELDGEREGERDLILNARLERALRRLNPWLSEENVRKAARAVTHVQATGLIEANEKIHRHLVHTLSVEQDTGDGRGRIGRDVRFIDFAQPESNDFVVTRQFEVIGTRKLVRFDLVCFVNGLPLAVIECKAAGLGEKWFEQASTQLDRYQEAGDAWYGQGVPRAFEAVQVLAAVAGPTGARLGTVLTPGRHFGEWREPWPLPRDQIEDDLGRKATPQDILLASAFTPAALLDLVANFTVFEPEGGRVIRKLARYQQFIAVNKALERIHGAPEPEKRGGIVWHTQGSGKSLTMLWLAVKLRRIEALQNPTLVIVTDRTDLDAQIHETFDRCGFPNPERAKSVKNLQELLRGGSGLTVMTTIQKFQDVSGGRGESLSEEPNIFVLVDEAHRTQYKSLAANMRKALPNACFLGFTGTPIDKNDRSTARVFGPYIHTYPIQQAVADGATVPIYYESRLPELRVEGETLDAVFERIFQDRNEDERAAIKSRFATLEAIAGAPKRIERICLDLIEHFEKHIHPNGFKAQVVACSRDAAVTYLEALEKLGAPQAAIIMSSSHNDPERLTRHKKTKTEQKVLIERFKNRDDPLSILVVCDMLLTGFDAPVEQVMYLDAPLREHGLLQAIARVNRRAEGKDGVEKDYGLVVDYWGISQELQDALAIFDPKDIQGTLTDIRDELPRLQQRHRRVMRYFEKVPKDDLESCIRALEPEDRRAEFEAEFRKFVQSLDMVLPDPEGLAYKADLHWLAKLRAAARARFIDPRMDLTGCGAKVKKLIEEYLRAEGISQILEPVDIFSKRFDEEVAKLRSPDAKASRMEHAIRHEINVQIERDPIFYQRLSDRLEELIRERREGRLKAAEELRRLETIREKMRGREKGEGKAGLSPDAAAFLDLLKTTERDESDGGDEIAEEPAAYGAVSGPDGQVKLVKEILGSLELLAVIDWTQKEDVQREMRRRIKRHLRAAGYDGMPLENLTTKMMDLARVRLAR